MAKITIDTLTSTDTDSEDMVRGSFSAETLTCIITRPNGEVVAELDLEPRAFKVNPKSGKGGVGWYAALAPRNDVDDGGSYRGIGVNGGIRLSVAGLKIGSGDEVDLSPSTAAQE